MNRHAVVPLLVAAGLAAGAQAQTAIYDSEGFENLAPGPLNGQDGWTTLATNGMEPRVVVAGPNDPAIWMQSIRLEVPDFTPAYSVIGRTFPDMMSAGYTSVTIRFSIFRQASAWSSNFWWYTYEQQGTPSNGIQWDRGAPGTSHTYPIGFSNGSTPTIFGEWREVVVTFDFANVMVWGSYDGVDFGPVPWVQHTVWEGWALGLDHAEAVGNGGEVAWVDDFSIVGEGVGCYPDCDTSTGPGVLDIFDFLCFQNRYDQSDPYACNCDVSTGQWVCDIFDFLCFQNAYDAGCP